MRCQAFVLTLHLGIRSPVQEKVRESRLIEQDGLLQRGITAARRVTVNARALIESQLHDCLSAVRVCWVSADRQEKNALSIATFFRVGELMLKIPTAGELRDARSTVTDSAGGVGLRAVGLQDIEVEADIAEKPGYQYACEQA